MPETLVFNKDEICVRSSGLSLRLEIAAGASTATRRRRDLAARGPILPATSKPLRSVPGVAEGLPGDCNAVDPRLELRGNAEVVHGRPDHQGVGNKEPVERRLARGHIPRNPR